jgi:hypothetical protein
MDDDTNSVRDTIDSALALLYDWFKYLTSLSLLTLGGVLTISQSADNGEIKPAMLMVVLVFVIASGVSAFSGAAMIVGHRTNNQPLPTYIHHLSGAAAIALCIGVGAFTYIFAKVI